MKPKVFLSHSKKDKVFIEKLANDLRSCGIDVWYDEWEIPPGESIRKKIFEDGITSCDMFFVYLTENSIPSYWVQKELDGAFIHEIETKNSFITLFVNYDESREKLSLDLKALNIPKFNNEDYLIPFGKLLSRIWNSYSKKILQNQSKDNKLQVLELENNISELQKKILQIEASSKIDTEKVTGRLKNITFEFNGVEKNLMDILIALKNQFADGAFAHGLWKGIQDLFDDSQLNVWTEFGKPNFTDKYKFYDFTGELIIQGLIEMKSDKNLEQLYSFSNQGLEYIREIGN